MNAKDTVVGTAKKLVAEIIGDGTLAEEGARQASGPGPSLDTSMSDSSNGDKSALLEPSTPPAGPSLHAALTNEERYAALLGRAALKTWSDLPREAQELLFNASVDDGVIANSLAVFLHDRHPKTAHPPKPTQYA